MSLRSKAAAATMVVALGAAALSLTLIYLDEKLLSGPERRRSAPLAEVTGQLRSINLDRRVVTVSGAGRAVRLRVTRTTTVFCHGRLGELSDLAEGQSVRASYEAGATRPEAIWIELLP